VESSEIPHPFFSLGPGQPYRYRTFFVEVHVHMKITFKMQITQKCKFLFQVHSFYYSPACQEDK